MKSLPHPCKHGYPLSPYWLEIHDKLFPLLADAGQEEPTVQIKQIAQILEIVRIEESIAAPKREGKGRPQVDRRPMARAFVAKAVLNQENRLGRFL